MAAESLDVVGVGNAIVDVIAAADDAFLAVHGIAKGAFTLIDEARANEIQEAMRPGVQISGGSAANSIACIAGLGGRGGFFGKVAEDPLGKFYRADLEALGVRFETAPLMTGPATARCLINVTSDAQRSMATYLGACNYLSPDDIDAAMIESAEVIFFEGYLFEQPLARRAFVKACDIAKKAGKRTAMTLSDAGVVDRQHDALLDFIEHVDILVANEVEARTFFETDDLAKMAKKARATCALTAITRSEKGSILVPRDGEDVDIPPRKPDRLVDTTGAGDSYAAGLLFGLARGLPLAQSGALGSLAAAEVISHFGARPEKDLRQLARQAKLL